MQSIGDVLSPDEAKVRIVFSLAFKIFCQRQAPSFAFDAEMLRYWSMVSTMTIVKQYYFSILIHKIPMLY